MRKVCGPDVYDDITHTAWVKIFSKMLKYIVPIAVKFEMNQLKQKQLEARQQGKAQGGGSSGSGFFTASRNSRQSHDSGRDSANSSVVAESTASNA
jgi:hypothetical protein